MLEPHEDSSICPYVTEGCEFVEEEGEDLHTYACYMLNRIEGLHN